jgi:predicted DNA-binding transcriptional regulator AlpA
MASTPAPLIHNDATAKRLGIAPQTLRCWRVEGKGPAFIRLGQPRSRVVYDPRAIEAWIESRTAKSTADPGGAK